MKRWLIGLLAAAVALPLALLGAGRLGLLQGTAPTDLGVREGRLKPPSATDNSVSSQAALWPGAREDARIAPLAWLPGDSGGAATMTQLQALVRSAPGARLVTVRDDYLHAEFTTPLLRFTDDVEFWLDRQNSVVQLRSASRLGEGDLGANRARIEALRAQLAGTAAPR